MSDTDNVTKQVVRWLRDDYGEAAAAIEETIEEACEGYLSPSQADFNIRNRLARAWKNRKLEAGR